MADGAGDIVDLVKGCTAVVASGPRHVRASEFVANVLGPGTRRPSHQYRARYRPLGSLSMVPNRRTLATPSPCRASFSSHCRHEATTVIGARVEFNQEIAL